MNSQTPKWEKNTLLTYKTISLYIMQIIFLF